MFFPQVEENINTRGLITQWRGYNHNYSIGLGEFYDMENMTSDQFPVMMARELRPTLIDANHAIRAILYTDSSLVYLDGNVFHFGNSWQLDFEDIVNGTSKRILWSTQHDQFVDEPDEEEIQWSKQKMIRFGTYVLIYPLKIWVDLNTREAGLIESSYESPSGITITYRISKEDGSDYQNVVAQDTAPENPSEGDYWLNTTAGSLGLNVYIQSSWQPVPTCYIRIEIPGSYITDYFEVDDVINLNSATLPDINNGSIIKGIGTNYIVVVGLMDAVSKTEQTSAGYRLIITRNMPMLDHIFVDKNRLWGCRYGLNEKLEFVNEIYASKLGDFKNWFSYQGIATDSYSATIGTPGRFTGGISYGGYPTFFKENAIIRVSGSYPAEYYVMQMDARGVQEGSDQSLAIVGETLYYKAPGGVMAYDGSLPRLISPEFGREYYYDGVAGVCGSKYYLEVTNEHGGHRLFVYDSQYGLWIKENHLGVLGFSGSVDGRLFAFTYDHVFGLGLTDNELYITKKVGEDFVYWYLETGEMGMEDPDFKFVSKISLRAYIPALSEVEVQISYDGKPWDNIGTIRGLQEMMTHTFAFAPYRCDTYRIRLAGHGGVRLYSLAITSTSESDEYGYKN